MLWKIDDKIVASFFYLCLRSLCSNYAPRTAKQGLFSWRAISQRLAEHRQLCLLLIISKPNFIFINYKSGCFCSWKYKQFHAHCAWTWTQNINLFVSFWYFATRNCWARWCLWCSSVALSTIAHVVGMHSCLLGFRWVTLFFFNLSNYHTFCSTCWASIAEFVR